MDYFYYHNLRAHVTAFFIYYTHSSEPLQHFSELYQNNAFQFKQILFRNKKSRAFNCIFIFLKNAMQDSILPE